jgi:hypothetical protein
MGWRRCGGEGMRPKSTNGRIARPQDSEDFRSLLQAGFCSSFDAEPNFAGNHSDLLPDHAIDVPREVHADVGEERIHCGPFALRLELDGSVRQVANSAGDGVSARDSHGRRAKAHSLDAAGKDALHALHQALLILLPSGAA